MSMLLGAPSVVVALSLALADPPAVAAGSSSPSAAERTTPMTARDPAATAAYDAAVDLARRGKPEAAIAKLDLAIELEPAWSEPVRLRADLFGRLAERDRPSKAFDIARASDLQRLVALEPGVDSERRQRDIAALQQRSQKDAEIERKRRRLMVPAIFVIMSSAGLLSAGALLLGQKPREFLEPTAFRQHRRDQAGIALLVMGGLLAPPAIVLGVLAGRQARRDAKRRDFEIETQRPRPQLGVSPQLTRRGAGMGMSLRF